VLAHYVANGILGALVGITAPCAVVHTYDAIVIGVVGSLVANVANEVIEHSFELDDPVGAVGVHALGGIWGLLAVGLFADGSLPAPTSATACSAGVGSGSWASSSWLPSS